MEEEALFETNGRLALRLVVLSVETKVATDKQLSLSALPRQHRKPQ